MFNLHWAKSQIDGLRQMFVWICPLNSKPKAFHKNQNYHKTYAHFIWTCYFALFLVLFKNGHFFGLQPVSVKFFLLFFFSLFQQVIFRVLSMCFCPSQRIFILLRLLHECKDLEWMSIPHSIDCRFYKVVIAGNSIVFFFPIFYPQNIENE